MVNFVKIFFLSFLTKSYSYCIPQNIYMNIPYQQQNISVEYNPGNVVQQSGLLHLILTQTGGTRIRIDNKIQYGKIDVTMKVANGNSIVSAFVLQSDETKDEVDFEFVRNQQYPNRKIQTTFYYRGIPLYNVNDLYIDTGIELAYVFNTYTIIWDNNFYEWRFNDKFLRRTYKNETVNYPDSLSNIKISIWEHEPSKWSGPAPNWNDVPFILSISSIKISCPGNYPYIPTTAYTQNILTTQNIPTTAYTQNITTTAYTQNITTSYTQQSLKTTTNKSLNSTTQQSLNQNLQTNNSSLLKVHVLFLIIYNFFILNVNL